MYFFYLFCGLRINEYVVCCLIFLGCNRKVYKVDIKNDFCFFLNY